MGNNFEVTHKSTMGSKTSKLAKRVAQSQQRAISPRERVVQNNAEMSHLSSGAPTNLRHNQGSLQSTEGDNGEGEVSMKEADKFRNDWFPNAHWEQYPVRGDIQEMAAEKRAFAPIWAEPDPEIPSLAEEKDNADLIRDLTFIGKGLTPGPDKSTQFPRLHRDESKMPKARVSMAERKLKGYLDANQFKELFEISGSFTAEELSLKFETQEGQLAHILTHTQWVEQPMTSQLQDNAASEAAEQKRQREEMNRADAARLHRPNQGGFTPYERGTGPGHDEGNFADNGRYRG